MNNKTNSTEVWLDITMMIAVTCKRNTVHLNAITGRIMMDFLRKNTSRQSPGLDAVFEMECTAPAVLTTTKQV